MLERLYLDDDTSELMNLLASFTGLTTSELINRLLGAHTSELYELLALADAYPELRDRAANLLQSFGPEPLSVGIKQLAPHGYLTLNERFERGLNDVLSTEPAAC